MTSVITIGGYLLGVPVKPITKQGAYQWNLVEVGIVKRSLRGCWRSILNVVDWRRSVRFLSLGDEFENFVVVKFLVIGFFCFLITGCLVSSIYRKGRVENGFLKAHLDDFRELFEFSQWFHSGAGQYYFRGQASSEWGLKTTLERFESGLCGHASGTGDFLLKDFKRLIRGKGLLASMNPMSDEEFFALGQHYGLPTPLLDWSESFYIALFFAFSEVIPSGVENVAVWAIQKSASEVMKHFNEQAKSITSDLGINTPKLIELKFVDPYTDVNTRLVSQSGIFLQKPSGLSIEELISDFCKGNTDAPVLAKITMPARERESVLNNLMAMNINWSTIYPGIEGAALHAKMKLELLNMKAARMGKDGVDAHANKNIRGSAKD